MKFYLLIVLVACSSALTASKSVSSSETSCVSILEHELEVIPAGVWENIQDCALGVVNAVLALGADLTESTSEAVINALNFKDLVLKCYNAGGKLSQAACVVKNIGTFGSMIKKIVNDASELYAILKDKGVILVDAVKSCHLHDPAFIFYAKNIAIKMEQCPSF